jgi:cytochrome b involved in lipid metabolism
VYEGTEYDATAYVEKHPGGRQFIENMKAERKDFTEYFKSLHSEQAQKILKSFPIVSQSHPSFESQQY